MKNLSDLKPLHYGHALLKEAAPQSYMAAKKGITDFFAQDQSYKDQHIRKEQFELGYRPFTHKELFLMREPQVPKELQFATQLASDLHDLSLKCMAYIASQLHLDSSVLLNLTEKKAFPEASLSTSVLRIIQYHPNGGNAEACDIHEDLGLLTLICHTGVPALEIYDFVNNTDWMDSERDQNPNDIIVMAGEALSYLSNGHYLPATHRVRKVNEPRLAILYQLRLKPDVILDSKLLETDVTGVFNKPFYRSSTEFMNTEIARRVSVNGSY